MRGTAQIRKAAMPASPTQASITVFVIRFALGPNIPGICRLLPAALLWLPGQHDAPRFVPGAPSPLAICAVLAHSRDRGDASREVAGAFMTRRNGVKTA